MISLLICAALCSQDSGLLSQPAAPFDIESRVMLTVGDPQNMSGREKIYFVGQPLAVSIFIFDGLARRDSMASLDERKLEIARGKSPGPVPSIPVQRDPVLLPSGELVLDRLAVELLLRERDANGVAKDEVVVMDYELEAHVRRQLRHLNVNELRESGIGGSVVFPPDLLPGLQLGVYLFRVRLNIPRDNQDALQIMQYGPEFEIKVAVTPAEVGRLFLERGRYFLAYTNDASASLVDLQKSLAAAPELDGSVGMLLTAVAHERLGDDVESLAWYEKYQETDGCKRRLDTMRMLSDKLSRLRAKIHSQQPQMEKK